MAKQTDFGGKKQKKAGMEKESSVRSANHKNPDALCAIGTFSAVVLTGLIARTSQLCKCNEREILG